MEIEVNELEPCKLSVRYEANALEILGKRADVQNAFKKAPVPGFRPGKATIEAINMHYRNQIDESLKRALAEDAFHNTLFEKKLRAHGAPRFNALLLDGGKFVCEFELYTKPDLDLPDWKVWEVPKPHENLSVSEISEKMLQELRVRLGDTAPYADSDFVQTGDGIIIDYVGTVDGVPIEGLSAQGETFTVGKNELQGFDSNLLGMTVGEQREFDFVAPDGVLPSLSGKTLHFKVTLTTGAKTVPCPLDDELAKRMGKKDFAEVRAVVSQNAFAHVANSARGQLNDSIARRLIEEVTVDVPNWMSLSEAQYLAQQSQLDWNKMFDEDREKFLGMAVKNVKLSLILDKVREMEPEAQLTDQETFEIVKRNLANSKVKDNLDEAIEQMNRTGYLQILFARIRDENTMDYLVKNVKVVE